MVTQHTTYTTLDGKVFEDKWDALKHEQSLQNEEDSKRLKISQQAAKFLRGYSGQRLLKDHSLDEYGIWKILGEDPNCDLGGAHYQPDLGIVEGELRKVVDYAVQLPDVSTWGSGGDIKKTEVTKIKKL